MSLNQSHVSIRKKISLILIVAAIATIYYFIVYFFCLFLINLKFISAFDEPAKVSSFVNSPIDSGSSPTAVATVITSSSSPIISLPGSSAATSSSPVASGYQPELLPNIADPTLFFGSYFDTFANSQYIDAQKTNMYYDELAAAYHFQPDYAFAESDALDAASREALSNVRLNLFQGFYNDERCLGNRCLEQKGSELFFNGEKLPFPKELDGNNLAALSIGSLSKRWLVGFTIKNGNNYEGLAYYFDGLNFIRILTPEPIRSPYFGVFGFGGGENNFLLIYGAYQGIAYHLQGDKVYDVSQFFDIRIMNGGFKPEIVFAAFESNVNWYIYSATSYHPVLIKLWQNRGSEIVGEAVLNSIFERRDESAVFKLSSVSDTSITLAAKLRRNSRDSWFYLIDYGFKPVNQGMLVSTPLSHDGYNSLVTIVKVANDRLNIDSTSADKAEFLVSTDGQAWQKLEKKTNYNINLPATRHFFLKVEVAGSSDKFYSPFISEILFDYYCRK